MKYLSCYLITSYEEPNGFLGSLYDSRHLPLSVSALIMDSLFFFIYIF